MSDTIVVMKDGRIQQQGDPTELYERPLNRFVAAFIGTSNFIDATVVAATADADRTITVRSKAGLALRGRLTDPMAQPPADSPVTVAIRPERLTLINADAGSTAEPPPGTTDVPGRIHQGTYLGDQTEYRVLTEQAGELIVRHQNAAGAGGALGAGPGDPVIVRWHEEANLVLVG